MNATAQIRRPAGVVMFHTPETVMNKVTTWFLMLPLFLFAGYGQLFLVSAYGNFADPGGRPDVAYTLSSSQWRTVLLSSTALFLIIIFLVMFHHKTVLRGCADNKLFLALAGLCFASTAWSQFPNLTLRTAVVITSDILFAIYFARRFSPEEQMDVLYCFGWIVVVMCPLVAIAFPQLGIDHREGEAAWQGVFPHKNVAGIVMVYLMSVSLYRKPRTSLGQLLTALYIVGCLGIIVMTKSRTGWALVVCLLVFVISTQAATRFTRRERPFIIAAMCLVWTCTLAVLVGYIPTLLRLAGKDSSMTGRLPLWHAVWHAIAKHPYIGYGYSAFWNGMNGESATVRISAGWGAAHAQSGFLDLWLGLGAIGIGLIAISLFLAVKNGLECIICGRDRFAQWYLAMVLITLVSNLDERSLMWPNCLEWVLYVVACVGLSDRVKQLRLEDRALAPLENRAIMKPRY